MGVPIWCTPRDKWVVLSGIELEWDRGGVRDLGQVLELEQGQGQGKHGGTSGGRGGMGHGQTTRTHTARTATVTSGAGHQPCPQKRGLMCHQFARGRTESRR